MYAPMPVAWNSVWLTKAPRYPAPFWMVGFAGKLAGVSQDDDGEFDVAGEVVVVLCRSVALFRSGKTMVGSDTLVVSQLRGSETNESSKRRRASSAGSCVMSANQTKAAAPKRQTPTMSHRRDRERVGVDFSLDITSTSWRGALRTRAETLSQVFHAAGCGGE